MFKTQDLSVLMAFCCFLVSLSIISGAFGAHALSEIISIQKLEIFKKSNFYLAVQSIGVLVLLSLNNTTNLIISRKTIVVILTGSLIFCISLYLVSFSELNGMELLKKGGIIAPFGGVLMIAGWFMAAINILKNKKITNL